MVLLMHSTCIVKILQLEAAIQTLRKVETGERGAREIARTGFGAGAFRSETTEGGYGGNSQVRKWLSMPVVWSAIGA